MTDKNELFNNGSKEGFEAFKKAIEPLIEKAYNQGFQDGLKVGQDLGYVAGFNHLMPAISDGLRHGSSECGKALRAAKNYGLEQGKAGDQKEENDSE